MLHIGMASYDCCVGPSSQTPLLPRQPWEAPLQCHSHKSDMLGVLRVGRPQGVWFGQKALSLLSH